MRRSASKRIRFSKVRALAPTSTVSALAYTATTIAVLYTILIVITVYFASLQTSLVTSIREHEGAITMLESTYYDGVARISSANPYGEGYVAPSEVRYVSERTSEGLTFAGR